MSVGFVSAQKRVELLTAFRTHLEVLRDGGQIGRRLLSGLEQLQQRADLLEELVAVELLRLGGRYEGEEPSKLLSSARHATPGSDRDGAAHCAANTTRVLASRTMSFSRNSPASDRPGKPDSTYVTAGVITKMSSVPAN